MRPGMSNDRKLVVLAYPRIDFKDNYECTWLPYSVLYIADALRSQGQGLVDVLVYDGNIHQSQSFESIVKENAARLLAVGFSIMTGGSQIQFALEMAKVVHDSAPHAIRMFGGPHANVLPVQTCRHPLVDLVTVGPGQYVVPPVVEALLRGVSPRGLPGVWTKDRDGNVVTPRPFDVGWKADGLRHWDVIDATPYIKKDDELLGERVLNYISSFGCCYRCRFCYEQQYGRRYHAISAEKVIEDVSGLADKYRLSGVKFYDADFFVNQVRAERIYTQLAKLPSSLAWAASIHPNDVLRIVKSDSDGMRRMADCGCKRLLMGVESGDRRVLEDVVQKMTSPEKILEAARTIDEAGIRGAYTFIIGFPGETDVEKQHTVEFAMELAALPTSPEVRFHGFAPYPGTPMYEDAVAGGFVQPETLEEWSRFDYYSMRTPWLTPEDEEVIRAWSKATGRRLVEKERKVA